MNMMTKTILLGTVAAVAGTAWAQEPTGGRPGAGRPPEGESAGTGVRSRREALARSASASESGRAPWGGDPAEALHWLVSRPGAAERLNLAPEKVEEIRALREGVAAVLARHGEEIRVLREKVREAMQADPVDEDELMADIRRLGFLETEVAIARARHVLRLRALVGEEPIQQAREVLREEIERRRREARERWIQERRGEREDGPAGRSDGEGRSPREAPWRRPGPAPEGRPGSGG